MEDGEKVSGRERVPARSASKEPPKAAQHSDKITHQMKIESGWGLSSAFVCKDKAIRVGCEETAWVHWLNASCLTNTGAPRRAGHNCALETRSKALQSCTWILCHRVLDALHISFSNFWFLMTDVNPEFTERRDNWPGERRFLQVIG